MEIWKKIKINAKNNLLSGLVIVVPLVISILVLKGLINFFDEMFKPILIKYIHIYIPGLGILISIIFIYLVGLFTKNYFGSKLVQAGEWFLAKIPVAKTVYIAVKQIMIALAPSEEGEKKKQKVVMIEYPRKGLFSIGLYNGEVEGPAADQRLGSVLIITSINPASGFTVLVPYSEIIFTDLKLEQAMKLIVSGGIILPEKINRAVPEKE